MLEFNKRNMQLLSRLGPAAAFGAAALELPAINENVALCTGDVRSFSGLDRFASTFPDKFYNFGIAEQNMLGAAAGMAAEGIAPFVTTYAAFGTLRCADQIRLCMAYMGLNIKLVGMTAGFAAGILGPTHICLEDVAFMRALPGITIIAPSDCMQIAKITLALATYPGPVYMRLTGGQNMPLLYEEDSEFQIGKARMLKDGNDIAIVSCGSVAAECLKAASLLEQEEISCQVWDMYTIRPLDLEALAIASSKSLLVSVEEHSTSGGLGDAISECLNPFSHPPLIRIGTSGNYPHAGSYKWLMEKAGLDAQAIAAKIKDAFAHIKI